MLGLRGVSREDQGGDRGSVFDPGTKKGVPAFWVGRWREIQRDWTSGAVTATRGTIFDELEVLGPGGKIR